MSHFSEENREITQDPTVAPTQPPEKRKPQFDPNQNHGRYPASDYSGCSIVHISHESLKIGDPCPDCMEDHQSSHLYEAAPQVVVRLHGTAPITGKRFVRQRLRCNHCGKEYLAALASEIAAQPKYDDSCRSTIAVNRYYAGMPFKRQESLQAAQGVPLADATQWDQIQKLYPDVLPVYQSLESSAAQGDLIHLDDTNNTILEASKIKKSVHTTAFVSSVEGNIIYLYYTSLNIAGANLEKLLEQRTTTDALITMADASSQNFPRNVNQDLIARWIMCFCLVHGRRKFYEIFGDFPQECEFVLNIIGQVYKNDAHCKAQHFTPAERLAYHQKHSQPFMQALWVWFNNQLLHRSVESNSTLGESIRYMLKHWEALTQFLRVAGAPIDNSLCEQAIKVAIRHRRNSLFYKTFNGAMIGDCLMSIIHTAARNKINVFDYLNTLQGYSQFVRAGPEAWLPWNYQETLAEMAEQKMMCAA